MVNCAGDSTRANVIMEQGVDLSTNVLYVGNLDMFSTHVKRRMIGIKTKTSNSYDEKLQPYLITVTLFINLLEDSGYDGKKNFLVEGFTNGFPIGYEGPTE